MPRMNLWIILIVIASMLGVWYFGEIDKGSGTQSPEALTTPVPEPELELPKVAEPSEKRHRRTQLKKEITDLQVELAKKAQQVEQQKQALERLQQQQRALSGTANLSSQIQSRDLAIQNLMQDLNSYQQAEEDINQSAAMAIRDQDSRAALARAAIDANVAELEQSLRNTQNELNYWRNYPIGADVVQQPAQIERLEALLRQQQQQLSNLRAQRVGISAAALNNTQAIQSLAEQAKAELRRDASQTEEQVYSLRSDMESLGRTQARSHGQLQNLNQVISTEQRELELRNEELQKIQDSIKTIQAEMLTL